MFNNWKNFYGILIGVFVSLTILLIYHVFSWQLIVLTIAGGLLSWIMQKPIVSFFKELLKRLPIQVLVIQGLGILFGLLIVTLVISIAQPFLELLSTQNRLMLTFLFSFFIITGLIMVNSIKLKELGHIFFDVTGRQSPKKLLGQNEFKILDTSVIIDGRIADLCKTGFLEGTLIIPNFVLNELQKIADSVDCLRRNRGRRGLDLLNKIQKENQVTIRIFDRDYEERADVDTKLLRLARELEAKVITNDFNLNKVAELYGVEVLNINELSNAIKPVVLPGEEMMVRILRDGKEYGQGIGYLEDGTMIVVEGGRNYIGVDLGIVITSILQTSAGRMIFAKPKEYLVSKITS